MIPDVGTTCLFTFTTPFATLNGVYRVVSSVMFLDALSEGVDFVDKLYTPAGLNQQAFATDRANYVNDRVVSLVSVTDASVSIFTPESIFLTVPDPTIKEYFNLAVVMALGPFSNANAQSLMPILDQIKDVIQSGLGIANPLQLLSDPSKAIYLSDAQYQALQASRQASITALIPLSIQLQQALAEKAELAAKCAAYENLIAQVGTTPHP